MRYCTLLPGFPPSSALGFGCGSLAGRVDRKISARALAEALDAGITHFDVARSYGYGDAEALLGEVLAGRREDVVIATKFGIDPPRGARALRRLKPLAQKMVAYVPALRPLVRSTVQQQVRNPHRFSPTSARASLEASLRALRTDYIDLLLLHECGADELGPDILDFLLAEKASGRIRGYGVTGSADDIAILAASHGSRMVYQFPNAITDRNLESRAAGASPRITHSPFAGAEKVRRHLARRPDIGRSGRRLGPVNAFPLMLAYALWANAGGVVLCSMLSGDHLKRNLAVCNGQAFPGQELAGWADLIKPLNTDAPIATHPAL